MKKISFYIIPFLIISLLFFSKECAAQEDTSGQPVVKLHYFNRNNSMHYLILESQLKKNKVFSPQQNKSYEIYLDSSSADHLISKVTTNDKGKAKAFIPASLKTIWDGANKHTFIVKQGDEDVIDDYVLTKAKMQLDTLTVDSVRKVTASVFKFENDHWIPAKDIEMKIGIQRVGGILSAGEALTYTTDSTGTATLDLNKLKLPGDVKGNYTLAASIEDNDELGNVIIEKTVPWGTISKSDDKFFQQRTLWSVRSRTPAWLLLMAYSIMIGVWGTIVYLIFQLIRVKKLGASAKEPPLVVS